MAGSGEVMTYGELEDRSRRLAQLLWDRGLRPGDHLAVLLENRPAFFEAVWAGLRSGLYVTTINRYLTTDEAGYILDDCGAKALVTSAEVARPLTGLAALAPACRTRLAVGGALDGYEPYAESLQRHPPERLDHEPAGAFMLYSSGTTGRPKGIRSALPGQTIEDHPGRLTAALQDRYHFDADMTYLSPAPLYHAAPAGFTVTTQILGGTVVVMERFDPEAALQAIEAHSVTHSQWVPTMFVRMLKLDEEVRGRYDLSSHQVAVHAAAPCPLAVKQQMMAWWGPIIHEYYAGTEGIGSTHVGPEDWLAHPGTVGQAALGTLHICDEDGTELGPNETGIVYFERPERVFEYHNDPERTQAAYHPVEHGWAALGDVGHLDDEGYLYLTDRATFMIVSGGVNIYPQEIEDVLILHPRVVDVAVFGVPNEDLGEEVKAVVQLVDGEEEEGPALAEELLAYAGRHLARHKVPRSVDFVAELPRLPTGKLYKRLLRDRYWSGHGSRIA